MEWSLRFLTAAFALLALLINVLMLVVIVSRSVHDERVRTIRLGCSDVEDSELHITVKTTVDSHAARLPPLARTWMQTINPRQVSRVHEEIKEPCTSPNDRCYMQ